MTHDSAFGLVPVETPAGNVLDESPGPSSTPGRVHAGVEEVPPCWPCPSPAVRSHFSGPGIGRLGGSSPVGPHQTWTAWMWAVGHLHRLGAITRLVFGVMLASPVLEATVSAIAV